MWGSGGAPPIEGLAIDEIAAAGADWIELYNAGPDAIAPDGPRIADDDKDAPGIPNARRYGRAPR